MSTPDRIPVISIARQHSPATLAGLDAACREWGFFQVVDHGIDAGVLSTLQQCMRELFALPGAAKAAVARTVDNPWGFYDRELTKNTRDWKQVFDYGPPAGAAVPQWPDGLPGLRHAVRAYYAACEELAFRLLGALARNLGVDADVLSAAFRPAHSSFVRLNYYPPCPAPARPAALHTPDEGFLGVNHHTDAGALTLLLQDDRPGLEVYRDGAWYGVAPRRDALVVNLGDIVQVWSNDRYRAALHRATASDRAARYSAPFFFNPAYDSDYAPLPSTVDASHPPRYRAINWGEFRAARSAGDYADLGEEVQISHYRLGGGAAAAGPAV